MVRQGPLFFPFTVYLASFPSTLAPTAILQDRKKKRLWNVPLQCKWYITLYSMLMIYYLQVTEVWYEFSFNNPQKWNKYFNYTLHWLKVSQSDPIHADWYETEWQVKWFCLNVFECHFVGTEWTWISFNKVFNKSFAIHRDSFDVSMSGKMTSLFFGPVCHSFCQSGPTSQSFYQTLRNRGN